MRLPPICVTPIFSSGLIFYFEYSDSQGVVITSLLVIVLFVLTGCEFDPPISAEYFFNLFLNSSGEHSNFLVVQACFFL